MAQGISQRLSMVYNETFASVAGYKTLRSFLTVMASQNLEYLQIDVKAAFLNGQLEEQIFMRQPEGFVDPTK